MKSQLEFLQNDYDENVNSGTIKTDAQSKHTNITASEILTGKYSSSIHMNVGLF